MILEKKKQAIQQHGNMRAKNVRMVEKHADFFMQASRATSALRLRCRIEAAHRKREGLQSWKTARAIDELQRPNFLEIQRRDETELELRQNTWVTAAVIVLSLCEMHDRMVDELRRVHSKRLFRYMRTDGNPLQLDYYARRMARLSRSAAVLWRFWLCHRPVVRHRNKVAYTQVLKKFLKQLGDSIRIPMAVRKKMRYVRLVQRRFRSVQLMRKLRRELGLEHMEHVFKAIYQKCELEVHRLRSIHKAFARETTMQRGLHRLAKHELIQQHETQTDEQINVLLEKQRVIVIMPEDLKKQLIGEFMTEKEQKFSRQVYRYGVALKQYRAQKESASESHSPQKWDGSTFSQGSAVVHHARTPSSPTSPTHPIKPYMRTLLTEEEYQRLLSVAMERVNATILNVEAKVPITQAQTM